MMLAVQAGFESCSRRIYARNNCYIASVQMYTLFLLCISTSLNIKGDANFVPGQILYNKLS